METNRINKLKKRTRPPNEKRSRNGCLTCKQRRVKCDEHHPICQTCKRLNLSCSYNKKYSWDEEALGNGTTFGRSNQYKKLSLQKKYYQASSASTNFIKSESLSKSILKENVRWIKIKKNQSLYFINTTFQDFNKPITTEVVPYISQPTSSSSFALMRILSSLLTCKTTYNSSTPCFTLSSRSNSQNQICTDSNFEILSTNQILPLYSPHIHGFLSPFLATSDYDNLISENRNLLSLELPFFSLNDTFLPFQNMSFQPDLMGNRFNSLPPQEKRLFHYFIDSICPNCVCYPNYNLNLEINNFTENFHVDKEPEINPYLYLIVPLALKSQIVMDTIMATSAHQLFILGNKDYEHIATRYSDQVIQNLPDIIKQKQESKSSDWDDVLATVLMLCFKEISSNCDYRSSWVSYLNCAKQFLKQFSTQNNFSPLYKFFARYFIVHEVMGETAWLQQKSTDSPDTSSLTEDNSSSLPSKMVTIDFTLTEQIQNNDITKYLLNESGSTNSSNDFPAKHDTVIDVVFGCCPYLISLIHKISNLGRCYEDLELESLNTKKEFESYILDQRDQFLTEIENLDQRTQFFAEIDFQSEKYIKIIAEIKRLSTLLYLFARVDLETLYYNSGNITNEYRKKYRYMKKVKTKLTGLYRTLPECPMSLLWPLFVLGLVAETEDDERWFVLDKLVRLQKVRELGSVKTAKDVVLAVWKELDLGLTSFRWKDMINGRAESLSLA